ncbi:MAG: beta strand repeat-containing protein, partial [Candidatus Kariarchaeaceae archaeon]
MNSVSDIVIVTVIDSTNPTFSTSPSNLQYAEGQTSNILTWNSTDLYPNTYIIYKDGSSIDTGSWTNASTITLNVDGLSKAVYNYTIVVVDVFNNQGVDTVFVTVIDQTDPVFADTPNDITYTEGSVGNIVNWTATDSYSGNYIILQDGFQVDINTWTSGVAINYPIDGLAKGVYNFTIVISDNSDNSIVDTVLVTVIDLTPPSLSSPANIQYEDGSTGNKITWNSVDNYPETMTVYRNGSVKFTGSWTSGDIEYIIDDLDIGAYNFTIVVVDVSGNSAVDTVIVTVVDTIDPTINSPTDVSYSEGATGQSISWTGTDNHPNNYVILLNGSLDSSSVWGSGIPIVYSVDGYAKGTYNVTITVFDTSNNSKSDTVIVIVNDTTNPSVNSPTDAQYSEGSTGNTIDWTSTENYPETYIIYQNGSQIDTNSWTSGIPINHDINGLPKGGYNFTIIIFDASNNYVVDTVFITVVDTTNPIFVESPTDLQYGEGITGNSLIWNSTDTYPGNYIIYLDDISVDTGAWTNATTISINVDGLSIGSYNYTILVVDLSGNQGIDTVIVTVADTDNPNLTFNPADLQYNESDTGNSLSWTATDLYAGNYIIYKDEIQVLTPTSWISGASITYDVDGLTKGIYNYTIVIQDVWGNLVIDTVFVTVVDGNTPNLVSNPSDLQYDQGSSGNTLSWTATDTYSGNYSVCKDGIQIADTSWSSGVPIKIDVDGLSLGTYNYTIIIEDASNNQIIHTVMVEVADSSAPVVITAPPNIQYSEGNVGNFLIWNSTDINPTNYTIYKDSSQIDFGIWTNAENISINIDSLSTGTYNYTIVILDIAGNQDIDIVFVTVVDTIDPNITVIPADLQYNESDTGNTISWTATDLHAGDYIIYKDGIPIAANTWKSSAPITYLVDNLLMGSYNYTVVLSDESNNLSVDTVLITVIDGTVPIWVSTPVNTQYSEETIGNTLVWKATDNHPYSYNVYQNGSLTATSFWIDNVDIIVNIDGLIIGTYNFTIIVSDDSNNTIVYSHFINIFDGTPPALVVDSIDSSYIEGTTGHTISWIVSDNYAKNYTVLMEGALYTSDTWTSNNLVSINVDGYSKGVYNFTVIIRDLSDNALIIQGFVTITDGTTPVINSSPQNQTIIEESTNNVAIWQINDLYPYDYAVYKNGILLYENNWTYNNDISVTLDNLEAGQYNFTIVFRDMSLNSIAETIEVTVIDMNKPTLLVTPSKDTTVIEGSINNYLEWNVMDLHPETMVLIVDGQTQDIRIWNNDQSIRINVDNLQPGFYNYTIIVYDESNNFIIDSVTLRVKNPLLIDTIYPDLLYSNYAYEGDYELISGVWTDINGGVVQEGEISILLYDSTDEVIQISKVSVNQGNYEIILNYTGILPSSYTWELSFNSEGYEPWEGITLGVTVLHHNYGFDVQISDELKPGEEYIITTLVYYEDNITDSSLSLNQLFSKGQSGENVPVEGMEVFFDIYLEYSDGSRIKISKSETTSGVGLAWVTLSPEETTSLVSITGLSISVIGDAFGNANQFEISGSKLPSINTPEPEIDIQIQNVITDNLIFVFIIIASLFIVGYVYLAQKQKNHDRIAQLDLAIQAAHQEIDSLLSL